MKEKGKAIRQLELTEAQRKDELINMMICSYIIDISKEALVDFGRLRSNRSSILASKCVASRES